MNEKCECDKLTRNWCAEDRWSLCGHVKECPRFPENFMTTAEIDAKRREEELNERKRLKNRR